MEGTRFIGAKEKRYKLWWSGNDEGVWVVKILLKEELLKKVVEVRRRGARVMAVILVFNLKGLDASQSGKTITEKTEFMTI